MTNELTEEQQQELDAMINEAITAAASEYSTQIDKDMIREKIATGLVEEGGEFEPDEEPLPDEALES